MIVQCSKCGKREAIHVKQLSDLYSMFRKGYRAIGSAIYCPRCVEEYGGVNFDMTYEDTFTMFLNWYIMEVNL